MENPFGDPLLQGRALLVWSQYQERAIRRLLRPTKKGETQLSLLALTNLINRFIEQDDTAHDLIDIATPEFNLAKTRRSMLWAHRTCKLHPIVGSKRLLGGTDSKALNDVALRLKESGYKLHQMYSRG